MSENKELVEGIEKILDRVPKDGYCYNKSVAQTLADSIGLDEERIDKVLNELGIGEEFHIPIITKTLSTHAKEIVVIKDSTGITSIDLAKKLHQRLMGGKG